MADHGVPLRIALLTYRGKPHVGGQGIYTRHLAKALVDLGHHVEVFSGQPYPEVDPRVPLHKLPSLDIYNDHFPMRMPGVWELKSLADFVEVTAFSIGLVPRATGLLGARLPGAAQAPRRLRPRPRQPEPRLRPARAPGDRHAPDRHDPPPDHGRPPPRDGPRRHPLQAADAAALVRLHPDADRGRPAHRAGDHRVGELLRRHPPRPQGPRGADAHRAGRRRPRAVPPGQPRSSAAPATSSRRPARTSP